MRIQPERGVRVIVFGLVRMKWDRAGMLPVCVRKSLPTFFRYAFLLAPFWMLDPNSFAEFDAELLSVDVLQFKGVATYSDRLKSYQAKTGLRDAVLTGFGTIEGHRTGLAVMDFNFLAATMGGSSSRLGRLQTGFVRSYALGMLGGAVIVAGALWAVTAG